MKKSLHFIFLFLIASFSNAQFTVKVTTSDQSPTLKNAILYTIDGSKYIIVSSSEKSNKEWVFKVDHQYSGMMKIYFPEINETVNFVSENKNINMAIETEGNKMKNVTYLDEANILMERMQDVQQKNEQIFSALVQIKDYYKEGSEFGQALSKEINRLEAPVVVEGSKFPFIDFYQKNYKKYVLQTSTTASLSQQDISQFIENSNEFLETSSLLRPILISYINAGTQENIESSTNDLIRKLDVETPRGQTVLSELIEIFDVYGMYELKDKLLSQAKNLKCTIHGRLASTLAANKNTEMGTVFPNYEFTKNTKNTQSSHLHGVKGKYKVVVFWSSTCSHCEKELPQFIDKYASFKAKNIEIIGLSLDEELTEFNTATKAFPWINDTELKGWNSSFVETYNIHATPTYFILDENNKIIAKPEHINDVFSFLEKSI